MGGRFSARLRRHETLIHTSSARGESISVKSRVAVLEAKFDLGVLDRLHEPCFVAIERAVSGRRKPVYLIYEVTGVTPTHFQMLAMNTSLPTVIRKEYLDTIYEGWGVSDETWVDVLCAPTGYMLTLDEGRPSFKKSVLVPLAGAPAQLLSQEATKAFLCVEGGAPLGSVIGFDIELTADIESLVRYHTGVFGFTGSGKSNLTSLLIRHALGLAGEGTVVVFDIAGEYAVNLADMLATGGLFYSTEELRDSESFLDSQTVPETLEDRLPPGALKDWAQALLNEGRVKRLHLGSEGQSLTLSYVLELLDSYVQEKKTGAVQASLLSSAIRNEIGNAQLEDETPIGSLPEASRERINGLIEEAQKQLNDRSALYGDLSGVANALGQPQAGGVGVHAERPDTPEGLAKFILSKDAAPLVVVYTPEPRDARDVSSRFINRMLYLKKHGSRRRVTVVFDEAQEFIPNETRRDDLTFQSSLAVESLLRQGRKYRAHCMLSTQRIAHLNTNALQQLHSYFVSTMPRYYDRLVVAEAFSLNYEVLERTTELDTGEWLFVSFKSTKQKNVPVFIQTENNEDKVVEWFGMTAT